MAAGRRVADVLCAARQRMRGDMRLAFLASNRGSAMRDICAAIHDGSLAAEAVLVVSNKTSSLAIAFARDHGVPGLVIPTLPDEAHADRQLCDALIEARADLVILSGYLRKLGPATLAHFHRRILNTHPSLLPDFGGQGMYGRRVHEAVMASGVAMTGITIHLVDAEYDQGPIVAQKPIPIGDATDAAEIERRVLAAEGAFFVETLSRLQRGLLAL